MAKSQRDKGSGRVVRRGSGPRRQLPPEIEALARGEKPPRRKPRNRIDDPRPVMLIPGVANRDARDVYDLWVDSMKAAVAARAEEPQAVGRLRRALAEMRQRRLWRGKSVTSFEAFAEDVLGLEIAEAEGLAAAGAEELGITSDPASDEAVAIAIRAEAALLAAEIGGRMRIAGERGAETLRFEVEVDDAPAAFGHVARRLGPMRRG